MEASSSDDELYLISYFVICKDSWIINHYFQLENFDLASPLLLNQLWSHSLSFQPEIPFSNNYQATNIFQLKNEAGYWTVIFLFKEKKFLITVSQEYKKFNLKFIFCKLNIAAIFHAVPSPPAGEQRQGFVDSTVRKNSFPPSVSGYDLWGRWYEKGKVTEPSSYQHPSSDGHSWFLQEERPNTEHRRKQRKRLIHSEGSILSYHTISSSLMAPIIKQIFSCHSFQLQRQVSSAWSHHSSISATSPTVTHALPDLFIFKTCSDLRL